MSSRSLREASFLAVPEPAVASDDIRAASSRTHRERRQANVFDAVAGLVTTNEPLASRSKTSSKTRYTMRNPTLAPEEVLFARRRAPQRYAERDIYFAHDELADGGRDLLPDGDLLKAVHTYASRFYEQLGRRDLSLPGRDQCFVGSRHIDERSMDETALLAFGILIEEAGREALGKRGDLVFTEGLQEDRGAHGPADAGPPPRPLRRGSRDGIVGFDDGGVFWKRNMPKRRRITRDEAAESGD